MERVLPAQRREKTGKNKQEVTRAPSPESTPYAHAGAVQLATIFGHTGISAERLRAPGFSVWLWFKCSSSFLFLLVKEPHQSERASRPITEPLPVAALPIRTRRPAAPWFGRSGGGGGGGGARRGGGAGRPRGSGCAPWLDVSGRFSSARFLPPTCRVSHVR